MRLLSPNADVVADGTGHLGPEAGTVPADLMADIVAVGRLDAIPTILEVVCRTTGMGFAAVARVTEDHWVACAVQDNIAFGLAPGGELPVETTICHEIRQSGQAVIIENAAEDIVFCHHPTPAIYGFQSYISVPIMHRDGRFFGTLCAIDPRPARLDTPETRGMFRLFADLIAFYLDAQQQVASSAAALLTEREGAILREEFIAVLGHDLRNPLAAIDAGTRMLAKELPSPRALMVIGAIHGSVRRMAGLIDNVLDFARGRLGGGITVDRRAKSGLAGVLAQVIEELRLTSPGRTIEMRIGVIDNVPCDPGRIGQLLSNLVGNALTHGASDEPVRVTASTEAAIFALCVANQGDPIPPAILERLFQPFFRGSQQSGHQGLGLGLYIASEIVRAHGGTLDVASSTKETIFTARIPIA